jgi:hypothetical protein
MASFEHGRIFVRAGEQGQREEIFLLILLIAIRIACFLNISAMVPEIHRQPTESLA